MRRRYTIALGLLLLVLLGLGQQWWQNWQQPTTETVFVYGTLTSPIVRFLTCRCHTPSTPHRLTGFTVVDRNLLPASEDAVVHGQILKVTPVELARFDQYERVPHHYVRVRRDIAGTNAWVYLKRNTTATTTPH